MFFRLSLALAAGIAFSVLISDRARASDKDVCENKDAAVSVRLAACSRIISRYRPSGDALAQNIAFLAYMERVELYETLGKFDLAIKDTVTAERIFRGDSMVGIFGSLRSELLRKKGDYSEAIAGLTAEIKKFPKSDLYAQRASLLEEKGDLDLALADISEAIRRFPTSDFLRQRAKLHYVRGEFDQALADHNESIQRNASGEAYSDRGIFWSNRGEVDKAKADYAEAITRGARNAWGLRALMWRDLGEYDLALADYEEGSKRLPENGVIRASIGEVWRLKGDLDRALAEQNAGLKLYPNNGVIHILRGDTLRYRGDYRAALADYDAASRQGVGYAIPSATGRGLTYEKLGQFTKAKAEFEIATKAGRNRILTDIEKSRFDSAVARLAALDSGIPQPVIAPAPLKAALSVPTKDAMVPATPAPRVEKTAPEPLKSSQAVAPIGRRVALVIGNGAYQKVSELRNPKSDADAVATMLRKIGFEHVTLAHDTSKDKLIDAMRAFAVEADKADWALVYYAGHGIEVNGRNYLIPVDAAIRSDRDVQFETVLVDQMMSAIEGAKKIKLIVLDACRDNPFAPAMERTATVRGTNDLSTSGGTVGSRSVGRGLSEVKVSGASLVVFAAKHGQVALDGEGSNSPFAVALVQRIATPGVEINKIFRLVRDDVMEATAGRQEPYTYGSLPGREDFFFVERH